MVHAEGARASLPPAACVRIPPATGVCGGSGAETCATAAPSVFDMPPGTVVDTRLVVTGSRHGDAHEDEDRYECGVTDYIRWAIARRRFLDGADDVELRPDGMPPEGGEESHGGEGDDDSSWASTERSTSADAMDESASERGAEDAEGEREDLGEAAGSGHDVTARVGERSATFWAGAAVAISVFAMLMYAWYAPDCEH